MGILSTLFPVFFEDETKRHHLRQQVMQKYNEQTLAQYVLQLVSIYEYNCSNFNHKDIHTKAQSHSDYMRICSHIQKYMRLLEREYYNFYDEYILYYDLDDDILYLKRLADIQRDNLLNKALSIDNNAVN